MISVEHIDLHILGAQICCQEELENSVNWLDAEKPGIEVFIFLKYIGSLRVSSMPQFELTYETGIQSSDTN